ncbi:InlB B-repeat-containing protein [Dysosmobacter welbionis]|uniref:InlB B-repeat-containing protein n=1 Tax=Dysosmobacter welbionis TaxID=2093857 RepID=UPI003AF7E108
MKKRILSILLLCCMVLTLLPTAAFAAGKIWVGTEEELLAALADNTIDKITLTADITVSQTLVIDRQVVLVLDHSLKIDREQSSSGTLFHITKSGYLDTNAGSITDNVLNEGKFFPRQISGEVINEGEIIRGSFSGKVKNRGSINYGSFRGEVENAPGGKIANGELYGEVTNHGEIAGWKFYGKVTNDTDGLITSGEFYGEVVNNGIISYGKFYGDVVNNGTITGGSFFGTLTGSEIQGDLYRTVTFDSDGGSAVTPQQVLRGQKAQRPAAPTKDGYTFIGWYNKADLQYINLPEWNFDYPVFENMELVAQWMEARPISTEPITYLDKDGNQQVCNKYTVLTSETKESILNYDDKWYDLPAGWYVVEGNVTITPRLDTHGAVNLILTNGSHLTAEWGIDVKVGDTFTVYAQSTDEGTMGRLTACLPADFNLDRMVDYSVWPYSGMAGIGSSARWREGNDGIRESEGTIVINGGNIRAKGQDNASAIGGTRAEEIEFRSTDRGEVYNRRQGGSITINGGVVRTEPFALPEGNPLAVDSVGIGTCQMGYGGSVTINGGTVIAEAANDAITTGYGGTITINGGDVTAIGGVNNFAEDLNRVIPGNGIGPYESGSVTINDGTVKATAKGEGFGIGGARIYNTGAMTVTINGGTIEATANRNNAAIGDRGKGKSGVTITDGVIHATGKGGAAGIGSKDDIRITGGELTVSAEGSGAAIGGFTDSHSERVNCKSITINGNVIQSISSKDGACIGGAAGGSVGSITVSDAELPLLSSNKILIGWDADSPGGKLTIRNCRVASTDTLSVLTDGIRVGSNSELVIEESEIRLPHLRGIRVGGNGSIAVRDSDLHTYGIFMDETVHTITDAKTLKKLEITDSIVLTGDIIGARGEYASVEEIVIRGSSIRLNEEYPYNRCTIGGGEQASFGSIDIQDSQIDITSSLNAPIGSGLRSSTDRESRIRIANSQVSVRNLKFGPAIGSGYTSHGGRMDIIIENSTVTAKGGDLRSSTDYIPGIGKNASGCNTVIGIQILNSTVDSFRLREKGDTDYVYDDLHTQELPGIPAENISICGSTVNRKTIDHSFDEYGKCTLCGKYDLGYCYEHGLLTLEGLTDCVSDGSEKKLTGLSHQTGENETKQLAENTDYTAGYSNNVHPYTLAPEDEGFDPAKAPKVTLYGTGNYCGKAEHYFTISENTAAAPTITTSSLPDGKVGEAYSQTLTADGTTPITWNIIGGTLPESLTLNETTGKISGTPTAAGTASFTVKAENSAGSDTKELSITITKAAPAEFTISVKTDGNGTASASLAKAAANTEITLSATPNEGYRFKEWEVISGGVTIVEDKFIMPDSDVEVKAIFEEDAPPAPTDPAKPSISVTGTYTYNGSEHTANVSGYNPATMDIAGNTATDAGDYTVRVTSKTGRWADGSTGAVTAAWSIGKATQEAPNGLIGVAPTTEGSSDGKITGADTTMEYRAESETIYTACAGIEIENLPAGNYFVRYAEDHNHFASPDTVVTVGDGAQLADCTITFNAGGGSGSMEPVTVKARTNYILPECGFTAPADQQFKAWEIGGTEYKVGDSYTVLGDTEIKALWENSVITPTTYTVTVSNDGNGTGTAAPSTAAAGTTITLTAMPKEGYHFKEWQVISGGVTIKDDKFLMPNDNVEVKAIFEKDAPAPTEYTITYDLAGGTAEGNPDTYTIETRTFTLKNPTKSGYTFTGWSGTGLDGENNMTVTIPTGSTGNRTYTAHWRYNGSGHSYSYYTIKATAGAGGSISPSGNVSVREGRDQTFTITPDKGYAVANVKIDGKSIGAVKSYTFENVSRTHTIEVIFMKANGNPQTGVFVDVATGSYYEDAVDWAVENGITKGTDDTHFSPDGICTRAQAVTFLWRTAGSPASKTSTMPFTDVPVGSYYYDAVLWAVENGITKGTSDTTFSPNMTCSRAQIVTFLWRSEKSPAAGTANPFADVKSTAYYADAVLWAVKENITKGTTSTTFSPNADCTRAQIVTFLWRCKK